MSRISTTEDMKHLSTIELLAVQSDEADIRAAAVSECARSIRNRM